MDRFTMFAVSASYCVSTSPVHSPLVSAVLHILNDMTKRHCTFSQLASVPGLIISFEGMAVGTQSPGR